MGFYWVYRVFTEFLPSFTEFYRVLPSFTEFYRVLPSFIVLTLTAPAQSRRSGGEGFPVSGPGTNKTRRFHREKKQNTRNVEESPAERPKKAPSASLGVEKRWKSRVADGVNRPLAGSGRRNERIEMLRQWWTFTSSRLASSVFFDWTSYVQSRFTSPVPSPSLYFFLFPSTDVSVESQRLLHLNRP